jgi:hypothetical protein
MGFRVDLLWGFAPTLTVYSKILPKTIIGICLGPVVVIQKHYKTDLGTLVHELEHCKQFWSRGLIVHFLRYCLSNQYRLRCEIEAYAAELIYRAKQLDEDAIAIASQTIAYAYRLNISEHFVKEKIRQELQVRLL